MQIAFRKKICSHVAFFVLLFGLLACQLSLAQTSGSPLTKPTTINNSVVSGSSGSCPSPAEGFGPFTFKGSLVPCGRSCDDPNTKVKENQDCTLCHLLIVVQNIFNLLLSLLFIAGILFITAGGVLYVVSAGTPAIKSLAKGIITGSIKGFAIFLLSWLIVITLLSFISYKTTTVNREGVFSFSCDTTSAYKPISTSGGSGGSGSGGSGSGTGSGSGLNNVGCGKVVQAGQQMMGWTYSQPNREGNSSADCSSFASRAWNSAGCTSPTGSKAGASPDTKALYGVSQQIGSKGNLKAGDILVYRDSGSGHAAVCENDGCSRIMHASSSKGQVVESNSDFMLNSGKNTQYIPASQYCGDASNGSGC